MKETIKKIRNKFSNKINNDYLDIWMQRLSYKLDPSIEYECNLCKVLEKKEPLIWESSWLSEAKLELLREKIKPEINWKVVNSMLPVISPKEVDDFITY